MMKTRIAALALTGSLAACATLSANTPAEMSQAEIAPRASIDDFRVLQGEGWVGSLTYLNYGEDTRSTIPVKLAVRVIDDEKLEYAIQYPGEEQYNAKDYIRFSDDGTRIDGGVIVSRETDAEGALVFTTEKRGRDNKRDADLQMVYSIAPDAFSIAKNVRFDGQAAYFNRNVYSFAR